MISFYGCSFTKYFWPGYVELLAHANPHLKFNTYASLGADNRRILGKLAYSLNDGAKKRFILWSGFYRKNMFKSKSWSKLGPVLNCYDDSYIKNYWSYKDDLITSLMYMKIAEPMITAAGTWIGMECEHTKIDWQPKKLPKSPMHFRKLLKFPMNSHTYFNLKSVDGHPDILAHYKFALKVAKALKINKPDLKLAKSQQQYIVNNIEAGSDFQEISKVADNLNWPDNVTYHKETIF